MNTATPRRPLSDRALIDAAKACAPRLRREAIAHFWQEAPAVLARAARVLGRQPGRKTSAAQLRPQAGA
ncbi:hypothetical protein [Variovorax terrae]|uniref:Uncharacterized protein n=1 Tax=Variovorax terrae TaxID=2923278 RepID=A0A9X1VZ12_9BURK|nr:hypothetical protein [Variovorax terrae]MCJ0766062.1 hypothetical protein [Variovorax terrae]